MGHSDCIIMSDLHLGARNSRPADLLRFLGELNTDRLILNGDIFDRPDFGGLRADEFAVIEALRDLAEVIQVDFVLGNHDADVRRFESFLGFVGVEETTVATEAGPYLVHHGHTWDPSMRYPSWLINLSDAVYHFSQRVDKSHRLARGLKRRCKYFVRAIDRVRDSAIEASREREFAGVIVGHTHFPAEHHHAGVHYINGGCWTERPTGYVAIRNGRAELRRWTAPTTVSVSPATDLELPAGEPA
jgi:UDP-2,3-diacylglucosamine pyrophosphatase LpxH